MYIYICIYMNMHMHLHRNTHIHINLHLHIHIHTNMHVHLQIQIQIQIYAYALTHTYTYIYIYACAFTYKYAFTFTFTYTFTYTYTNTYIQICIRTDRLSAKRLLRFYDGLWVVAWWNHCVFPWFLLSILHFGVGFTIQNEFFCGFASAKRSIGINFNVRKWVNFWSVFRFATAKRKRSRHFSSRHLAQRLRGNAQHICVAMNIAPLPCLNVCHNHGVAAGQTTRQHAQRLQRNIHSVFNFTWMLTCPTPPQPPPQSGNVTCTASST